MDYRPLPGLQYASLMLLFWGFMWFGTAVPQIPQRYLAEDLKGKPVDPFASSAGRAVVLIFVRTDCPISNRYAPTIQKLNEEFRSKANFWLVYPDADETAGRIRTHDEQFHFSIPALRDVHHDLVKRAHATIIPEAAVFDATGKLVYHGRIDNWYEDFGRSRVTPTTHELDDALRNTLDGKAAVPDHANAVGCYISDLK
jgi:thiol-disulfide isomerase/thioredoxin